MGRVKIAAGNWKMNKGIAETKKFITELKTKIGKDLQCDVIVAPPFTSLAAAAQECAGSAIRVSAQNVSNQINGAFTGEVSPLFLKEMGVGYAIIGHSERRTLYSESDSFIREKIVLSLAQNVIPIFCIGETLAEREAGKLEEVLTLQINEGLKGVPATHKNLIVAYEPVWAIGTGKVASKEDAEQAHAFVRQLLGKLLGKDIADQISILYGGSAKPDNIAELIAQPNIDGGLIGGASLDPASFAAMIEIISQAKK